MIDEIRLGSSDPLANVRIALVDLELLDPKTRFVNVQLVAALSDVHLQPFDTENLDHSTHRTSLWM